MRGALARLEERMEVIDLPSVSGADLGALTSELHRGLARIEGYLTRVARELRAREVAGSGPAAEEVLRDSGNVSFERAGAVRDRAGLAAVLPGLGAGVENGEVRTENADQVARVMDRLSASERVGLAAHDAEITRRAGVDSPEVFGRFLRRKREEVADPPSGDAPSPAEREKEASGFAMGRRATGRWWLSGDLDHERAAEINDLVNRWARQFAGEGAVEARHRAAALHGLVTGAGGVGAGVGMGVGAGRGPGVGGGVAAGGGARMGIGYVVDARTLFHGRHEHTVAETWGGDEVDPAAAGRLACDADLYAAVLDRMGAPVAVGRTHRSATRAQRLALRALYRTCPLDGVTPFERCEIHHVNRRYELGGETELHNLLPVSLAWHHRIHDRGWVLEMGPDRSLELRRPDGTLHKTLPPPTPITRQRE